MAIQISVVFFFSRQVSTRAAQFRFHGTNCTPQLLGEGSDDGSILSRGYDHDKQPNFETGEGFLADVDEDKGELVDIPGPKHNGRN